MTSIDTVHGLLHDGPELEDTIENLRRRGLRLGEIEVLRPPPGSYRLADESLHDDAAGARSGALRGAGTGVAVGVAVSLLLPVVAAQEAAVGALVVAAFAGFGALVGGLAGLLTRDLGDDDPERVIELRDGDAVVEVHCLPWRNRAHRILERHGARILDDPSLVRPHASDRT